MTRKLLSLSAITLLFGCVTEPTTTNTQFPAPHEALRPSLAILPAGAYVVSPAGMNGWYFWNDKDDIPTGSPGELVSGPGTPPLGVGSVRLGPLTDIGTTGGGHSVIATNDYLGTRVDAITSLSYSTYQPGPVLAIALQFDVRYRPSDVSYGGRLVFEPYQNGAVSVGAGWQSWSPLAGKWWASKTTVAGTGGTQVVPLPAGNCAQATPCTWAQLLAAFPDAIVAGRFLFKAGSNWNGFDGNADALTVGVNGANVTYDFEPYDVATTKDECKNGGWAGVTRTDGSGFKNQGDCVSYTVTGK